MLARNRKRGDTRGVRKTKAESEENLLIRAANDRTLQSKLKKYLKSCHPPPDADPKKNPGRLPNLAGLCAFLGCGLGEVQEMKKLYPKLYDHLCAVLEDEALNFAHSPTLLGAYLKERLGYGDKREEEDDGEPLQPIYEHDILKDGE